EMKALQATTATASAEFSLKKVAFFTGVILLIALSAVTIGVTWAVTKFTYDKDYFPLVSADAIAAMKYGPNKAREDALVEQILQQLQARNPNVAAAPATNLGSQRGAAPLMPVDRIYTDRLLQLRARRDFLREDQSSSPQELRSV